VLSHEAEGKQQRVFSSHSTQQTFHRTPQGQLVIARHKEISHACCHTKQKANSNACCHRTAHSKLPRALSSHSTKQTASRLVAAQHSTNSKACRGCEAERPKSNASRCRLAQGNPAPGNKQRVLASRSTRQTATRIVISKHKTNSNASRHRTAQSKQPRVLSHEAQGKQQRVFSSHSTRHTATRVVITSHKANSNASRHRTAQATQPRVLSSQTTRQISAPCHRKQPRGCQHEAQGNQQHVSSLRTTRQSATRAGAALTCQAAASSASRFLWGKLREASTSWFPGSCTTVGQPDNQRVDANPVLLVSPSFPQKH
jgi:hypothetical protein